MIFKGFSVVFGYVLFCILFVVVIVLVLVLVLRSVNWEASYGYGDVLDLTERPCLKE